MFLNFKILFLTTDVFVDCKLVDGIVVSLFALLRLGVPCAERLRVQSLRALLNHRSPAIVCPADDSLLSNIPAAFEVRIEVVELLHRAEGREA